MSASESIDNLKLSQSEQKIFKYHWQGKSLHVIVRVLARLIMTFFHLKLQMRAD